MPELIKKGSRGAAVLNLQTVLGVLGADLKVDGIFGDKTEETVLDFQAAYGLVEDGIVGDKTWKALELALHRKQHMAQLATDDKLKTMGEAAVKDALSFWESDIYDPKPNDRSEDAKRCRNAIYGFIVTGTTWLLDGNYDGDGDFEWCTAFAWSMWGGKSVFKPELLSTYAASTYRMDRYGSYRSAFGEANPMPEDASLRRLYMKCDEDTTVGELPWIPRAGDIALVGPSGYGKHGVLVEKVDLERGLIWTVEGNSTAGGPKQLDPGEYWPYAKRPNRQQGVGRGVWYFGGHYSSKTEGVWHIRRVVRPGLGDLLPREVR